MYLGIDLGTSEVKVLLVDDDQRIAATGRTALTMQRPRPLWSEQHPQDWWQATQAAVAEIQKAAPRALAAVRGIGLSGQMHGATLLDSRDEVLRPAILWNDVRSGEECRKLEAQVPNSRELTGNLAMPGFTAPKLLWVAKHEPEVFARTAKVLLPKDYLRLKLTGEYVSEMSDAAGTLWLDVARRDWSDTMLAATRLSRANMPSLVEGSEASGQLLPEVARAWGMGRVVVAGGAGDNAASAIGMGIVNEGESFISLGTSGVFFVANDAYRPNPARAVHAFCHALPGRWHQMAVMLSAATCLRWVTHVTHAENETALLAEVEALDRRATDRAPIFLPYLAGERTPHNDPHALGVWFGLTPETDRARLVYSVIEGVAFGLVDGYQALQEAGSKVESASLVGGGSRSLYWARLLASAMGFPLKLHSGGEVGAALGAARLGMLAANQVAEVESLCIPPPVVNTIQPVAEWRESLLTRLTRFRKLYPAVRGMFSPV